MKGGGRRNHTHHLSPIESPPSDNESGPAEAGGGAKEQDKFLPIANVSRIMKKTLPTNAKISKEAKETVQECVSEFISFITGEASDKCQKEKRKTINGDDLLWAMTTLGFENYVAPLKVYLNKYRETEGDKSGTNTSNFTRHADHNQQHSINTMGDDQEGNNYSNNNGGGGAVLFMPSINASFGRQGFGGGKMSGYGSGDQRRNFWCS